MTDAHFHRNGYDTFLSLPGREFRFLGFHPWQAAEAPVDVGVRLRGLLENDPRAAVGEIGLDRLRTKTVPDAQRAAFAAQLDAAAALGRPVVLHGAKCWGEVVKACAPHAGRIPAFLFHGFSRSEGLLPEIFALNGFVSVGPALLNDHAVNYRGMVKGLPLDRVLVETDRDWSPAAGASPAEGPAHEELLADLVRMMAGLRGLEVDAVVAALDANATRFVEALA